MAVIESSAPANESLFSTDGFALRGGYNSDAKEVMYNVYNI